MHHGAVSCTKPIQSAHPDVANSAKPAILMAHFPWSPVPRSRSQSHGPAISDTPLPAANSAMTTAPSSGLPDMAATASAEYSSPQGKRDHKTPIVRGAAPEFIPWVAVRTLRHTVRAEFSSHTGWRARHRSIKPISAAATWNSVHTGRSAADWTLSQPRPCMDAAASAPNME